MMENLIPQYRNLTLEAEKLFSCIVDRLKGKKFPKLGNKEIGNLLTGLFLCPNSFTEEEVDKQLENAAEAFVATLGMVGATGFLVMPNPGSTLLPSLQFRIMTNDEETISVALCREYKQDLMGYLYAVCAYTIEGGDNVQQP